MATCRQWAMPALISVHCSTGIKSRHAQVEVMELHNAPTKDCTHIIATALPTCKRLHTLLLLVGHKPLDLSKLARAQMLECLALNFCAGMEASQLLNLTKLRSITVHSLLWAFCLNELEVYCKDELSQCCNRS